MSAGLRDVLALAADGSSARVVAVRTGLPLDLVDAMLDHAGRMGLAERAGAGSTGAGAEPPSACHGCPATRSGVSEAAPSPRRLPLACAGCFVARR